jgi:hypothetical protein
MKAALQPTLSHGQRQPGNYFQLQIPAPDQLPRNKLHADKKCDMLKQAWFALLQ